MTRPTELAQLLQEVAKSTRLLVCEQNWAKEAAALLLELERELQSFKKTTRRMIMENPDTFLPVFIPTRRASGGTMNDERPMCARVTEYAIQHTDGKCPRRAVYKLVHRETEEVAYRCSLHDATPRGWARFKIGKDGKALQPNEKGSSR